MNLVFAYLICLICQSYTVEIKFSQQKETLYDTADSYITLSNENTRRVRREVAQIAVNSTCKSAINEEAKKKIGKHNFPLKESKHHDLSVIWLGDQKEVQMLMTTVTSLSLSFEKSPTKLYKSTNGGKTFEPLDSVKLGKNAVSASNGINKSPVDNKRLILVAYEHVQFFQMFASLFNKNGNSTLLVTLDSAASFQTYTTPFKIRDGKNSFRFHPTRKDWILALEAITVIHNLFSGTKKQGTAWLSKDFGKTWTVLFPNEIVEDVKWGTSKGKEDTIYLLTHSLGGMFMLAGFTKSSKAALYRSIDVGVTFKKVVESCKSFGIQGEFVFATVNFKEKDSKVDKRVVHISHDNGDKFFPIHLPAVDTDQFYSILDMHKGMIFMHLDEPGDTGKGTLYISGPEGRMYTKSLENHFYTDSGLSDFYRVESMEGVYLTQQLTEGNNLKSVISRDRGQTWEPIKIDKEKYCKIPNQPGKYKKDCTLHYHHVFTRLQHKEFAKLIQSPLSAEKAPGIILIHGQAGDALTGTMDVWMSKNGGYDWTEVAKGPHHYAIGDGGNLIVLVPKYNSSGTTLKYSIDQGRCWNEYEFADTSEPLNIHGLVTEPHSEERSFSLWGFSRNAAEKDLVWILVTVDFHKMFTKKCEDNQFENWYPHNANGKSGCFLGLKKTYKRPKEDAVCYVGKNFNPVVSTTKCKCTKNDLQCDYGYDRLDNGTCKRNMKYTLMICKDGYEEKESFTKGYRLISGDECEEKDADDDRIKSIKTPKMCEENIMVGIVDEEKKEKTWLEKYKNLLEANRKRQQDKQFQFRELVEKQQKEVKHKSGKTSTSKFVIVICVIAVLCAVLGIGWYGRNYWRLRNRTQFQMSRLREDPDIMEEEGVGVGAENNAYNPTPASQRPYKDESDWDDEELLAV